MAPVSEKRHQVVVQSTADISTIFPVSVFKPKWKAISSEISPGRPDLPDVKADHVMRDEIQNGCWYRTYCNIM